jgi:hypothetical protein
MRAGPLSSPRVIELLNARFVPVFAVNEDYREAGSAPAQERTLYDRVYREALEKRLSAGTVHAYIVDPTGHVVDSLHVAEASRTERLLAMLERATAGRTTIDHAGPLVKPRSLSIAPQVGSGSVVLHLTARGRGNSWDGFPSENWIVLGPRDCAGLLPQGKVKDGLRWDVREDVATAILTHFYPQTENNDVTTHRFERRSLSGQVLEVKDGVARARVEGELEMSHRFYPGREDSNVVRAKVIGSLEFEPATGSVRRFLLVTAVATYGKGGLDVAVRSVRPDVR